MSWHHYINVLVVKLNRTNPHLFKIRNYINQKILRSIYFAIFDSHLNYVNLILVQNSNAIQRIIIIHKKAIRIISFQPRNFHSSSFFRKINILKFKDKMLFSLVKHWITRFLLFLKTDSSSAVIFITIVHLHLWKTILIKKFFQD